MASEYDGGGAHARIPVWDAQADSYLFTRNCFGSSIWEFSLRAYAVGLLNTQHFLNIIVPDYRVKTFS